MRTLFIVFVAAAVLTVTAALHRFAQWHLVAALAAALILLVVVHALVLGAGFALSRCRASPIPPGFPEGGGLWHAFWGELRVSLRAFHWSMPFRAGWRPAPPVHPDGIPVLLLHGYLCNSGMWHPMMSWLTARGHPVEALDLTPPFAGIEVYAEQVHQAVSALRTRTGTDRIVLLCHSMGGLVARYYVHACGADHIARVITLGSPHHGTRHAYFGLGRNARQMRRNGPWLTRLAAEEGKRPEVRARFVTVMTYHDNIVAPQESAILPGSVQERFAGIGHLQLASDRRVLSRIAPYLG